MVKILTTKELAEYLNLHQLTICKYASSGRIPGTRIGGVWRFDKGAIDKWLKSGQKKHEIVDKSSSKTNT